MEVFFFFLASFFSKPSPMWPSSLVGLLSVYSCSPHGQWDGDAFQGAGPFPGLSISLRCGWWRSRWPDAFSPLAHCSGYGCFQVESVWILLLHRTVPTPKHFSTRSTRHNGLLGRAGGGGGGRGPRGGRAGGARARGRGGA